MITIISPSKTQDFSDIQQKVDYSQPALLEHSGVLVSELRKKSEQEIASLMEVSDKIASLNYDRYKSFSVPFSLKNAKQALFAFKGDVYTGIDVDNFEKDDLAFAQDHLRILSGLYGILRPLDLIQPYRLEMKIKLKNPKGGDLYKFWGDKLTEALNEAFKEQKVLINLASNEYFKAVNKKKLDAQIITPVFKEFKNGKYSTIAIFAKKARGMMTDYIIKNRIENPEQIKTFNREGYEYSMEHSRGNEWVFIR